VTIHTRLHRRKDSGIYHCRVAVPKQLQHIIGKKEIHVSLKTSDLAIARERVKLESSQIDQMLAKASGRNPEQALVPRALPLFYTTAPATVESISFGELVERYEKLPERANFGARTKLGYTVIFRMLTELFGKDTPISSITRIDCRRVQEVFTYLPANSTKRFPNMSLVQIAAKARKDKLQPMNRVSANIYIMRMAAILGWAVQEGLIPNNPALGLLLPETELAREKRLPFTTDELKRIFNNPEMQAHKAKGNAAYWIPILALWTGARLNELCQLLTTDITELDGIACMMITGGDGKQLKTANSKRIIPLHPKLIEAGFLEYMEGIRTSGATRLFSDLRVNCKGSYSDKFSKDFAYYLKKISVKSSKNCFHSFRHCFRDALRDAGIEREIVQALGGWRDTAAGAEDIYGKGHSIQRLYAAICKIMYKDLPTL